MPTAQLMFQQLGLAVLLGLLVGLQRERSEPNAPGVRTFALITVLGTVSAWVGLQLGGWVVMAGLLGVLGVTALPKLLRLRDAEPDPGITTDVAALLMYVVGALLVVLPDRMAVAVAVGGGVAVLLQYKPELHGLVERLGDQDMKAIMQFVLITCVILPVLPNENYLLDVLNPRETWLMVVLIVAMSLGGYVAYKLLGRDAGILLGGLLGGAISSTATTVSYSRQTRTKSVDSRVAAVVIMIASTVVFVRVLIEIAVVAPMFLERAAPPIGVLMTLMVIPSALLWHRVRREPSAMPEQGNPSELKSAILFGVMYALVLLALAAVKRYVGDQGLYAVSILSGLTDMDAITLSVSKMFRAEGADSWIGVHGWRLIIAAALSNLVFKGLMVGVLGDRALLRRIALMYALPFVGGLAVVWFWP